MAYPMETRFGAPRSAGCRPAPCAVRYNHLRERAVANIAVPTRSRIRGHALRTRIILTAILAVSLAFTKPIAEAATPMTMADLLVTCYGEEGGPDRNFCLGYLL